jgi:glycosyltransferase involved in cell wall biosynthesis
MVFLGTLLKIIKVGHLTSVHPPFDVRIFYKECVTLAGAGYEVVLIAPYERNEVVDGVRIRAVPKPKNRLDRMTRTVWRVFKAALDERLDFCHFHDPELIPIATLLKLTGKRVIYDVHENVREDILAKTYINPRLRTLIAWLAGIAERISAICFDGIVAATPAIAKRFPSKKSVTVHNFPVLDNLPSVESQPYTERGPIVAYVGVISVDRGLKEMIEATAYLPPSLNAKLVLAGSCDSEVESAIQQTANGVRVEFKGWLSQDGVSRLLSNTRVGLVLLHAVGGFVESYPIKMFEYMATGVPIVASDFPLWGEIIRKSKCGILVNPLDPKSIALAIQWLLEHPDEAEEMGRNGREAARARYNWLTEAQQLRSFYRKLLGTVSSKNEDCESLIPN